jgi:hypothetical protein
VSENADRFWWWSYRPLKLVQIYAVVAAAVQKVTGLNFPSRFISEGESEFFGACREIKSCRALESSVCILPGRHGEMTVHCDIHSARSGMI